MTKRKVMKTGKKTATAVNLMSSNGFDKLRKQDGYFNFPLANELHSLDKAVMLAQLNFWLTRKHCGQFLSACIDNNNIIVQNCKWIRDSITDLRHRFSFWSYHKIRYLIDILRKQNLVLTANTQKTRKLLHVQLNFTHDNSHWFTINNNKLQQIYEKSQYVKEARLVGKNGKLDHDYRPHKVFERLPHMAISPAKKSRLIDNSVKPVCHSCQARLTRHGKLLSEESTEKSTEKSEIAGVGSSFEKDDPTLSQKNSSQLTKSNQRVSESSASNYPLGSKNSKLSQSTNSRERAKSKKIPLKNEKRTWKHNRNSLFKQSNYDKQQIKLLKNWRDNGWRMPSVNMKAHVIRPLVAKYGFDLFNYALLVAGERNIGSYSATPYLYRIMRLFRKHHCKTVKQAKSFLKNRELKKEKGMNESDTYTPHNNGQSSSGSNYHYVNKSERDYAPFEPVPERKEVACDIYFYYQDFRPRRELFPEYGDTDWDATAIVYSEKEYMCSAYRWAIEDMDWRYCNKHYFKIGIKLAKKNGYKVTERTKTIARNFIKYMQKSDFDTLGKLKNPDKPKKPEK